MLARFSRNQASRARIQNFLSMKESGRSMLRLIRCVLEPICGSYLMFWIFGQCSLWRGHRGDIGEGIWATYGFSMFFWLMIVNGPVIWFCREAGWFLTALCLIFEACWWLYPLDIFPLRAPLYLGACAFWLLWPYWVTRSAGKSGSKPAPPGLARVPHEVKDRSNRGL